MNLGKLSDDDESVHDESDIEEDSMDWTMNKTKRRNEGLRAAVCQNLPIKDIMKVDCTRSSVWPCDRNKRLDGTQLFDSLDFSDMPADKNALPQSRSTRQPNRGSVSAADPDSPQKTDIEEDSLGAAPVFSKSARAREMNSSDAQPQPIENTNYASSSKEVGAPARHTFFMPPPDTSSLAKLRQENRSCATSLSSQTTDKKEQICPSRSSCRDKSQYKQDVFECKEEPHQNQASKVEPHISTSNGHQSEHRPSRTDEFLSRDSRTSFFSSECSPAVPQRQRPSVKAAYTSKTPTDTSDNKQHLYQPFAKSDPVPLADAVNTVEKLDIPYANERPALVATNFKPKPQQESAVCSGVAAPAKSSRTVSGIRPPGQFGTAHKAATKRDSSPLVRVEDHASRPFNDLSSGTPSTTGASSLCLVSVTSNETKQRGNKAIPLHTKIQSMPSCGQEESYFNKFLKKNNLQQQGTGDSHQTHDKDQTSVVSQLNTKESAFGGPNYFAVQDVSTVSKEENKRVVRKESLERRPRPSEASIYSGCSGGSGSNKSDNDNLESRHAWGMKETREQKEARTKLKKRNEYAAHVPKPKNKTKSPERKPERQPSPQRQRSSQRGAHRSQRSHSQPKAQTRQNGFLQLNNPEAAQKYNKQQVLEKKFDQGCIGINTAQLSVEMERLQASLARLDVELAQKQARGNTNPLSAPPQRSQSFSLQHACAVECTNNSTNATQNIHPNSRVILTQKNEGGNVQVTDKVFLLFS